MNENGVFACSKSPNGDWIFLGKLTTKEKMEGVSYCPKPGGSVVKNPPASAGDTGSIPGEDPLEKEMTTHSSFLAWRSPWTAEPGRVAVVHGVTKNQT